MLFSLLHFNLSLRDLGLDFDFALPVFLEKNQKHLHVLVFVFMVSLRSDGEQVVCFYPEAGENVVPAGMKVSSAVGALLELAVSHGHGKPPRDPQPSLHAPGAGGLLQRFSFSNLHVCNVCVHENCMISFLIRLKA